MGNPNKNCPNCQGVGERSSAWNREKECYETIEGAPCPVCHADFDKVREFAEKLLLEGCGKKSLSVTPDELNSDVVLNDCRRYNRLLNWLWTHPPHSGQDRNGLQKGGKRTKQKSFRQLFSFERPRKPRIPKLDYEGDRIIPWFAADVKLLLESWGKICKHVPGEPHFPITKYIKASTAMEGVFLDYCNLTSWHNGYSPACVFSYTAMLLPGHLVREILRKCDRRGSIAFGFDPFEEVPLGTVILHENASWRIPLMQVDAYPVQTWPEANAEVQEVA